MAREVLARGQMPLGLVATVCARQLWLVALIATSDSHADCVVKS
jgi:hypothetical protein